MRRAREAAAEVLARNKRSDKSGILTKLLGKDKTLPQCMKEYPVLTDDQVTTMLQEKITGSYIVYQSTAEAMDDAHLVPLCISFKRPGGIIGRFRCPPFANDSGSRLSFGMIDACPPRSTQSSLDFDQDRRNYQLAWA